MKCDFVFEVEKGMADPAPKSCPCCKGRKIERHWSADGIPSVAYPGRPPWTYKEALRYKTCSHNGGPTFKIDPRKHGDIGSWHCSLEKAKKTKKKGR
jgi:hypothetical protein